MEDQKIIKEEDKVGPIPRYYHEAETARLERTITRLFWALIMTILLLVGTNAGWIWYESQFQDESWTFEATTEGAGNAIANGNGEVHYYGEGEGNTPKEDQEIR